MELRKLLKVIYATVMRSVTAGCSGAITVYLTICYKQVEKHRRQQLIMNQSGSSRGMPEHEQSKL